MPSNSCPQGRQNSGDNVFEGLLVGAEEAGLLTTYLAAHDFSDHTRRAIRNDLRKFARWFSQANAEPFRLDRVTLRDVTDFRNTMRREQRQAVATVNRGLVSIRRFFDWLVQQGKLKANPAKAVKELRRQTPAPLGLERAAVRRLFREIELRQDVRAGAIFSLLLYTGCRVSDVTGVELPDMILGDRSGSVVFRHGKGNKERRVPLPLSARTAIQAYLAVRPPVSTTRLFVGERGPMTPAGVRNLCRRFSAAIGVHLHPHLFRHTFAKQFLVDNGNDLVALAQVLGHEPLTTTSRYAQQSEQQVAAAAERVSY